LLVVVVAVDVLCCLVELADGGKKGEISSHFLEASLCEICE
jgi:hypothetical protein